MTPTVFDPQTLNLKNCGVHQCLFISARVPTICSQRWILAYIGFFGFGVVYSLRVNISVGIVCMVKTPVEDISENLYNNTTTLTPDHDAACVAETKAASHSNDVSIKLKHIAKTIVVFWLLDQNQGRQVGRKRFFYMYFLFKHIFRTSEA